MAPLWKPDISDASSRIARGALTAFGISVALFLAGFGFAALGAHADGELSGLVPTPAVVEHYRPGFRTVSPAVSVSYRYDGVDHLVRDIDAPRRYTVGERITVYVDPVEPNKVRTKESAAHSTGWVYGAGLCWGFALAAFFAGVAKYRVRRSFSRVLVGASWRQATLEDISDWDSKGKLPLRCVFADDPEVLQLRPVGSLPDGIRPIWNSRNVRYASSDVWVCDPVGSEVMLGSMDGRTFARCRLVN